VRRQRNLEKRGFKTCQVALLPVGLLCKVLEPTRLVSCYLQVCLQACPLRLCLSRLPVPLFQELLCDRHARQSLFLRARINVNGWTRLYAVGPISCRRISQHMTGAACRERPGTRSGQPRAADAARAHLLPALAAATACAVCASSQNLSLVSSRAHTP
jgi:predicted secreted protein